MSGKACLSEHYSPISPEAQPPLGFFRQHTEGRALPLIMAASRCVSSPRASTGLTDILIVNPLLTCRATDTDLFSEQRASPPRDALLRGPPGTAVLESQNHSPNMLTPEEIDSVLYKVCLDLGFCDIRSDSDMLRTDDIDEFTRAIRSAEGLPPDGADRHLYRQVRHLVANAFEKHAEKAFIDLQRTRA